MGFEIVEHTADVGIRAWGATPEEAFEQTTHGLLEITGAWRPGDGGTIDEIAVEARDLGALLVDWLDDVLYMQDATDSVITSISVDEVNGSRARGRVGHAPREEELEGTAVKAITYHRLVVEREPDGSWRTQVYLDI